jgi:hypothetical protein
MRLLHLPLFGFRSFVSEIPASGILESGTVPFNGSLSFGGPARLLTQSRRQVYPPSSWRALFKMVSAPITPARPLCLSFLQGGAILSECNSFFIILPFLTIFRR